MIKLYQGFANCQTITPLKIEKLFLCAFIVSTKRLNYIIKIMSNKIQLVSAVPSNAESGVLYCIAES